MHGDDEIRLAAVHLDVDRRDEIAIFVRGGGSVKGGMGFWEINQLVNEFRDLLPLH